MGLLVFVRNLLLALCLFLVLGFLYYSAWKLHFLQWEDSSKYGPTSPPPGKPVADQLLGFHGTAVLSYSSKMGSDSKDNISGFRLRNCLPLLLL